MLQNYMQVISAAYLHVYDLQLKKTEIPAFRFYVLLIFSINVSSYPFLHVLTSS